MIRTNHKIYYGVLFIFLISVIKGFSQNDTKLQEYLPPSPTAQEFIKYGEYPVGMYTGIPNISIPLYAISIAGVSVPISLSYHSAGIQVDQVASQVGLGWSLNTGGTISKIPRGKPDDTSHGFLLTTVVEFNNLVWDHDYYEDVATGIKDTESDIYYYNFTGYSGKFFFDRSKKIRLIDQAPIIITYDSGDFVITTKDGIIYEFGEPENSGTKTTSLADPIGTLQTHVSSWHLTKITPTNKIDTITFTYETVNSFTTQQYNYSESTGSKIDLTTCPPSIDSNVHDFGSLVSQTSITSYPKRLKEISFTNGKVEFNKLTDRQDKVSDRLHIIKVYQKEDQIFTKIKEFEFYHDYYNSTHTINAPKANGDITTGERKRLKLTKLVEHDNINNETKEHSFDYNSTMLPPVETNGKDFWGYYNGKNSNTTLIPKQTYQYFGNDVGSADREPNATFMQAGILTKITYPTQGYTEFSYEPHEYKTTENVLVSITSSVFAVGQTGTMGSGVLHLDTISFTPNHSGFATVSIEGSDMTDASGGTFATVKLKKSESTTFLLNHSIDPYNYSYPMNPPDVTLSLSPVWLEKDVTYVLIAEVVGGSSSTEFGTSAYMMADIDYNEESGVPVTVTKMTGGLRIKQIKSFHENNELAFSKKYEYNNATLLTPETFLKEQYLDTPVESWSFCQVSIPGTPACLGGGTIRRFYYGGTVQSLTLNGGSPVVYGSVDEFIVDELNNDTGKTTYTYNIQTDEVIPVASSYNGGVMLLKKDWMGGQNKSTTTYADDAIDENDFITSDTISHTIKRYDESYKMYKIVHSKRISGNCMITNPSGDLMNRFEIFEYPIYTGVKLPSSTQKTTKFELSSDLVTTTNIFYDNDVHLQPTRTETTKSNGEKVIRKTSYPDDVTDLGSLGYEAISQWELDAIKKLQAPSATNTTGLHQIATPVQVEIFLDSDNDGMMDSDELLSFHRNNFEEFSGLILPDTLQTLKGVYHATSNPLIDRIEYHDYYVNGKVKEISKTEGPHIVYIWGYEEQFPIAKIENATYSDIPTSIYSSIVSKSNLDDSDTDEDILRTELDKLRNSTYSPNLSDAKVTTYTYNPLIGVTSITDPKGYTTYYQYDDFGRLEFVKDQDGNILSKNQYHYKN